MCSMWLGQSVSGPWKHPCLIGLMYEIWGWCFMPQDQGMRFCILQPFGTADSWKLLPAENCSRSIKPLHQKNSAGYGGKYKRWAIQGISLASGLKSNTVGWVTIYSDHEISDSHNSSYMRHEELPSPRTVHNPIKRKTTFFKDNQLW